MRFYYMFYMVVLILLCDVMVNVMVLKWFSRYLKIDHFRLSLRGVHGPDLAQSSLLGNLCFASVVLCVNVTLVFRQYSWCLRIERFRLCTVI